MMEDKNTDIVWGCGIRSGKIESEVTKFKYWFKFDPTSYFYEKNPSIEVVLGQFGNYSAETWNK